MKHPPTDEQQAAIDAAARSAGSLMMTAYAGCAKSSTLEMMAPQIAEPSLALAFNKHNADELRPRLPDNFIVKTLNGLGHGAWMRRPGIPSLRLEERKLGKLVTETAKESSIKLSSEQWDWTRRLVSQAMLLGIVPRRFASEALEIARTSEDDWLDAALQAEVPADEHNLLIDLAKGVLERDIEAALRGQISFDDQVYCPTVLGGQWPKYPTVMIDESQDLSWLNHQMLAHCLRERLIAVGDPLQAIYAFRGADHESMTNLRLLRNEWRDLPLTMTFRCPKEIVARQQGHAKGFRAAPSNSMGLFARPEPLDVEQAKGGWDIEAIYKMAGPGFTQARGDMAILCRNNGPLLSLAFKLLRKGIGVKMLGRDIGKGLIALSKKVCPTDEMTGENCIHSINEWREREVRLAEANGRDGAIESVNDRADCLIAVLESAEARDAGQLRGLLEHLFSRQEGLVVLSSIHRAKGAEWEIVVHLDPWRIPSKWARRKAAKGDDRELRQEMNLLYVCETRTRDVLIEARLEDFRP